ncbi:hypothetical protein AAF712_009441 [Marasmius tenuissimus]|uniref:Uncharacterized protein n=1 Tax=Marasmius tenuissimus TaxID=585030 RepID=A0ABR2ZQJ9_9AGAR
MDPFQRVDPQTPDAPISFTTHPNSFSSSPSTPLTGFTPHTHFRPNSAAAAPNTNFLARLGLQSNIGENLLGERWPPPQSQQNNFQRAQSVQPNQLPPMYRQHNLNTQLYPDFHQRSMAPQTLDRQYRSTEQFTQGQSSPLPGLDQSHGPVAYSQKKEPSRQHQLGLPTPGVQNLTRPQPTQTPIPLPRTPQPPRRPPSGVNVNGITALSPCFAPAPRPIQWQTPTVINNVDARALRSLQPPPLPTPSPKQPGPSLPFNPPSASHGPSAINSTNIPASTQDLLLSSSTVSPLPRSPAPAPREDHVPRSQSTDRARRNGTKSPVPSSMGPAVQQHNHWSSDTPSSSKPVPRPRMGKAEKALKAKVSDTDVVKAVTRMLNEQDKERKRVADELGISETRLRNLIGVHESFRAEKKPSAYNASVHWKADQLNAGRAVSDRATLEDIHIAFKEDAEMMAVLQTWKEWKEEKAWRKAAKKAALKRDGSLDQQEVVDNGGDEGSDDEDEDNEDDEEELDDSGEIEAGERSTRGTEKQLVRAHLAEVRRWFEALEVSKAEKFIGNRGSTKSVKKEGNVGVSNLNRLCENLYQKTGGLFWGFACRSTYNTALIPGMFGVGPLDDYLTEKQGISAYEFISSVESFACEQALHGTKAMTVEKMKIYVRSKLEQSLREATGNYDLAMKYENYEALVVEPYKVQLAGWPDNIPFKSVSNLNNTDVRDLYGRVKSESLKWVKMQPQEYRRWKDDFETCLENGDTERPKRTERSDKGGTHNTTKSKSKKRGREIDEQEPRSKSKPKKSKNGTTTQSKRNDGKQTASAKRKPTGKMHKSAETIDDSNEGEEVDLGSGEKGDGTGANNQGPGDQNLTDRDNGVDNIERPDEEDLDEESRREMEADPDANDSPL